MQASTLLFWMAVFGTVCWPICFLLMHRLSVRQNALLNKLQEQGKRIEQLSQVEHDLIRGVHPQVMKSNMSSTRSQTASNRTQSRAPNSSRQVLTGFVLASSIIAILPLHW